MAATPLQPLRLVYLAGSGHTGSTLLALFMDAHPQIVSVGETSFKLKLQSAAGAKLTCTCGSSYFDCEFWQQIFHSVRQGGYELNPSHWSNDFRYRNRLAHRLLTRYSARPSLRLFQQAAAAVLPWHRSRIERVRRVNVELVRAALEVARADVFFDTSKAAVRLKHLLEAPELDVKVVRLIRDVRGYAWSAKRRGGDVQDAASTWRKDLQSFDYITRNLSADRVMVLRYEDVCRDPRTWLRSLYAFCGVEAIDPPDFVVSRDHHVLGNSMRRSETIRIRLDESWRTSLTDDEQARVLAIAGRYHAKLGYGAHAAEAIQ
jgi:hypothetical protein